MIRNRCKLSIDQNQFLRMPSSGGPSVGPGQPMSTQATRLPCVGQQGATTSCNITFPTPTYISQPLKTNPPSSPERISGSTQNMTRELQEGPQGRQGALESSRKPPERSTLSGKSLAKDPWDSYTRSARHALGEFQYSHGNARALQERRGSRRQDR